MPSNNEEEEYPYSCSDCGTGLYEDDVYTSDYDDNNNYRCSDCHYDYEDRCAERESENDYVHDYGYKPSPSFLHDDGMASYYVQYDDAKHTPLYMGIELEVEAGSGDRDEGADDVLSAVNQGFGHEGVIYLKEDGSLNHGFEIVSHPATLGFYMNHFKWDGITKLRRHGFKSWNAPTCGLHIHLSRSAFVSDRHLTVFIMFLFKNAMHLVRFAGRNSERYASWEKDKFMNAYNNWSSGDVETEFSLPKFIKWGRRNEDRFTAINLRNRDTIELRFFRPSLRPETVQAALQMCDALHQYSSVLTIHDMTSRQALDFRSFRSWLDTQDDKYKVLADRIDARNNPSTDN